jgi:3-dehydroquinate synthase
MSDADYLRTVALLKKLQLPTEPPRIGAQHARDLMGMDKKVLAGKLRLVLLRSLGDAIVTADYPAEALDATLQHGFA